MPDRSGELRRRVLDAVRRGLPADQARLEIASLYNLQVADLTWESIWAESVAKAEADPAIRSREDALAYLEAVRIAAEAHDWSRHAAGDRDRAVLLHTIATAHGLGWIACDLGTRAIAEAVGFRHGAVAECLERLEAEGWLEWKRSPGKRVRRAGESHRAAGTIKLRRSRLFDGCSYPDSRADTKADSRADTLTCRTGLSLESPDTRSRDSRELPGSSAEPVAPAAGEDDAAQLRAIAAAWPPVLAGDLGPVLARVTPVGLIAGTLTLANHPGEPFDTEIVGRVRDGSAAILGALRAAGFHVADLGITYLGDARLEAGVAG